PPELRLLHPKRIAATRTPAPPRPAPLREFAGIAGADRATECDQTFSPGKGPAAVLLLKTGSRETAILTPCRRPSRKVSEVKRFHRCGAAPEVPSYCRALGAIGRAIEVMPPTGFVQSPLTALQDFLWHVPARIASPPCSQWSSGERPQQPESVLEETSCFPEAQRARRLREPRAHRRISRY